MVSFFIEDDIREINGMLDDNYSPMFRDFDDPQIVSLDEVNEIDIDDSNMSEQDVENYLYKLYW